MDFFWINKKCKSKKCIFFRIKKNCSVSCVHSIYKCAPFLFLWGRNIVIFTCEYYRVACFCSASSPPPPVLTGVNDYISTSEEKINRKWAHVYTEWTHDTEQFFSVKNILFYLSIVLYIFLFFIQKKIFHIFVMVHTYCILLNVWYFQILGANIYFFAQ